MHLLIGTKFTKENIKKLNNRFISLNIETELLISEDTESATLYIEKNWKSYERVIFLDENGIFPFMYLSKVHKLVVARITDIYSAYMTPLHNNTKIIIIPTSIISDSYSEKLAVSFINADFEAGRHMVRIDMLDKETK